MSRFLNKIYAKAFGYFWLPCPVCGKHFGGHEASYGPSLVVEGENGDQRAFCVCSSKCSLKAAEINKRNGFYAGPVPIGPFC